MGFQAKQLQILHEVASNKRLFPRWVDALFSRKGPLFPPKSIFHVLPSSSPPRAHSSLEESKNGFWAMAEEEEGEIGDSPYCSRTTVLKLARTHIHTQPVVKKWKGGRGPERRPGRRRTRHKNIVCHDKKSVKKTFIFWRNEKAPQKCLKCHITHFQQHQTLFLKSVLYELAF